MEIQHISIIFRIKLKLNYNINLDVSGSVLGRVPTMNATTGAGIQNLDRPGACARKLELDMKDRYD